MDYLNLGCGSNFHPNWTNVDFTSTGEGVIAHNLREGIPFDADSFDAVYHSHVLEHFSREEAGFFIQECFRVLRPGGILRVVVPDLENITRLYLKSLEHALAGSSEWANNHDWMMLELYDQVVRTAPGGAMAAYLRQSSIPNKEFVVKRLGQEADRIIQSVNRSANKASSTAAPLSEREALLKELLGDRDYEALRIGRFRQRGEIHQWMYDRFSLTQLLEQVGFEQVRICRADESQIPEFNVQGLDIFPDGRVRKPDSLFVEACKIGSGSLPTQTENPSGQSSHPRTVAKSVTPPKSLHDLAVVQELRQQVQALQQQVTSLDADLQRVRKRARRLKTEKAQVESAIAELERSRFWKLRNAWFKLKGAIATGTLQATKAERSQPSQPQPAGMEAPTSSAKSTHEAAPASSPTSQPVPATLEDARRQAAESSDDSPYFAYLYAKIQPFTQTDSLQLRSVFDRMRQLEASSFTGDVVHCGELDGGIAAMMAHFVSLSPIPRTLWLIESSWLKQSNSEVQTCSSSQAAGKGPDLPRLLTALNLVNSDMTRVNILGEALKFSGTGGAFAKESLPANVHQFLEKLQIAVLSISLEKEEPVRQILKLLEHRVVSGGAVGLTCSNPPDVLLSWVEAYLSNQQIRYHLEQCDRPAHWVIIDS